ncbi:MAG: lamin tail domain-containing protein [Phycisphaerae bacterium]|jgi:hypothetical protein|nr:lamin tail domain-containing protein [Phycisphaerae bacterium]
MDSPKAHQSDVPLFELLEPRLLLSGSVVISEFMASNSDALLDGDGNSSDWIELYNPTDTTVDLAGWYLTDDSDDPDQWAFPSGGSIDITLSPGEYLLVFASGQDDIDYPYDDGTYYHTNFKLSSNDGNQGEDVMLVEDDGTTIAHAYYNYPLQLTDVSYGIYLGATWDTLIGSGAPLSYHVPTPGDAGDVPESGVSEGWTAVAFDDSSWTDSQVLGAADVIITEINTGDTDFVEIQNVSGGGVAVAGWSVLVNDPSGGINGVHGDAWDLSGTIDPGEVLAKNDSTWGSDIPWATDDDGWAMIVDDGGAVRDFAAWGYTSAEIDLLDISHGGFSNITVGSQWTGDGAPPGRRRFRRRWRRRRGRRRYYRLQWRDVCPGLRLHGIGWYQHAGRVGCRQVYQHAEPPTAGNCTGRRDALRG